MLFLLLWPWWCRTERCEMHVGAGGVEMCRVLVTVFPPLYRSLSKRVPVGRVREHHTLPTRLSSKRHSHHHLKFLLQNIINISAGLKQHTLSMWGETLTAQSLFWGGWWGFAQSHKSHCWFIFLEYLLTVDLDFKMTRKSPQSIELLQWFLSQLWPCEEHTRR